MEKKTLEFKAFMNEKTAEALIKFVEQVEVLTAGVVHEIGLTTAGEILTACCDLRCAINKDETILR